jgi:HK97 family phage prohead protease
MGAPKPDFSGYVTKYNLQCTDGRTIQPHAFKHNDGAQIPLVWQHQHNDPMNVLGHLVLEHRNDGVYARGYFNNTPRAQHMKGAVEHKDINKMSIYANKLQERGPIVTHGDIKEGSLVMAGANPGAVIDNVYISHSDGSESVAEGEVIIYLDAAETISLEHDDSSDSSDEKPTADNPDPDGDGDNDLFDPADGGLDPNTASVQDVFNTLTDEQKSMVYALVGAAADGSAEHSDLSDDASVAEVLGSLNEVQQKTVYALLGEALEHTDNDQKGSDIVTRNVFDQNDANKGQGPAGPSDWRSISHDDMKGIFADAERGGSLRQAVKDYALAHGIDNIGTLFPPDQAVSATPEFITRRMEWVAGVLNNVHKVPFARIRSWSADLTFDDARARGYIKTNLKKEQFFNVAKRVTTPQTVYKKQKLERDDILDITEFDVVQWMQTELRVMLDEELARAILVGDGREVDDEDRINPLNIRPILGDDPLYVTNLEVDLTSSGTSADDVVDAVVSGMRYYRGSGNPVLYTTLPYLSKLLLVKDTLGRRLYANKGELASAMTVSDIIPCEALEATPGLIGIIVNLTDYSLGADKGGQVSMFDFFDIDYNQQKYLIETRVAGAMTKYRGAITIQEWTGAGGVLANPTAPTFVKSTGVVTIPTTSHVTYVVHDDVADTDGAALSAGAQSAISAGATVHIRALPASTYTFVDDQSEDWYFTRDPA